MGGASGCHDHWAPAHGYLCVRSTTQAIVGVLGLRDLDGSSAVSGHRRVFGIQFWIGNRLQWLPSSNVELV